MGMHIGRHAGAQRLLLEPQLHRAHRQAPPARAEEQGVGIFRQGAWAQQRVAHRQPGTQRLDGLAADRHRALARTLAGHGDFRSGQVEPAAGAVAVGIGIAQVQLHQLGQPQPA
ncbi:hypothetical protein D3C72_1473120 [compost metagenome]